MALDQSMLTETSIATLLREHYGIAVLSARRLPLGTANCYQVETDVGSLFLKEFQSNFKAEDLIREVQLSRFLSDSGIPTTRFLLTRTEAPYIRHRDRLICLEEYIEGEAYGYEVFPDMMMPELSRMLGRIHRVLRGYPLPHDMGKAWLEAYSPVEAASRYEELISFAEERVGDPKRDAILAALQFKKDLSLRCGVCKAYYEGVTYGATHGDYQGCQVICEGNRIKAVTNFSSARVLPLVWEVMRSFVQSSVICRRDARIDVDGLCRYVKDYMSESPLTQRDLEAMPYIYLFQLARSSYGFPQYPCTNSEDREALLRFALWRTAICREVEAGAKNIATALLSLL